MKPLNNKSRAQTMVEFALVLPILMIIIFGLLEVGRMVFVYVTVASASREAVRYGSATGINTAGGTNYRYKDCAGIRSAAQKVNFLKAFNDSNIEISYIDEDGGKKGECPVGGVFNITGEIINGDRIQVIVKGNFEPIVSFVPLMKRTFTSKNLHTIIKSAVVPPKPWGYGGSGGGGGGTESGGFPDITDRCPNIAGDQITVPTGYSQDTLGYCYLIPASKDICPLVPGNQAVIPPGYYYIDGKCIAPNSEDLCPNLPDFQPVIPPGYDVNSSGDCFIDVCTNLAGLQETMPEGYRLASGICEVVIGNCPYGQIYDPDTDPETEDCKDPTDFCDNHEGIQPAIPPGEVRDEDGTCHPVPECSYASSGKLPALIVKSDSGTDSGNYVATWTVYNKTINPLKINSAYITWNDTNPNLSLSNVRFSNIDFTEDLPIKVSGYSMFFGSDITISDQDPFLISLSFSYEGDAPEDVLVQAVMQLTFDRTECIFNPVIQPYCTLPNMLESNCAVQNQP